MYKIISTAKRWFLKKQVFLHIVLPEILMFWNLCCIRVSFPSIISISYISAVNYNIISIIISANKKITKWRMRIRVASSWIASFLLHYLEKIDFNHSYTLSYTRAQLITPPKTFFFFFLLLELSASGYVLKHRKLAASHDIMQTLTRKIFTRMRMRLTPIYSGPRSGKRAGEREGIGIFHDEAWGWVEENRAPRGARQALQPCGWKMRGFSRVDIFRHWISKRAPWSLL